MKKPWFLLLCLLAYPALAFPLDFCHRLPKSA